MPTPTRPVRAPHPYARPRPPVRPPPVSERASSAARALTLELEQVQGPYALRPAEGSLNADLIEQVGQYMELSYAPSTNRVDASHMRAWTEITSELGTAALRDDAAANSGADPVGHRNELILMAIALLKKYLRISPRSHADPVADPNSAMAMLRGVR